MAGRLLGRWVVICRAAPAIRWRQPMVARRGLFGGVGGADVPWPVGRGSSALGPVAQARTIRVVEMVFKIGLSAQLHLATLAVDFEVSDTVL